MARPYAVFDIDGTLVRWQLYHSVVSELAKQGKLPPEAGQAIQAARLSWKRREGREAFREYEQIVVKSYLSALTSLKVSDYLTAVDAVFEKYKDQVYTFTRDLLKELKAKNYLLFAISGSQQEIIDKLAGYYGFDDAIGAQLAQKDGYFTGQLETPALGKQKSLETLLSRHDVTSKGSLAVGDSESDEALLRSVEVPIAFNPTAGLFAIAKVHGWQVVIERKSVIYKLESQDGRYVLA